MLGPTLEGKKIDLEPARREDFSLFQFWFADPDVARYTTFRSVPGKEQRKEWYEDWADSQAHVLWRISEGTRTVGLTTIKDIDWINRRAQTNLMIGDRTAWGKGFASEAVHLRTTFAFGELGLASLRSESFAENLAMHRALQKQGYRQIASKRHYAYADETWHDMLLFELLRDDWLSHSVA